MKLLRQCGISLTPMISPYAIRPYLLRTQPKEHPPSLVLIILVIQPIWPKQVSYTENQQLWHLVGITILDQPFEPQSFIKASKNINKDFDPLTDVRGSADYRRKAAQNLVIKYGYELTGSFVPNLADRNQVENLVS